MNEIIISSVPQSVNLCRVYSLAMAANVVNIQKAILYHTSDPSKHRVAQFILSERLKQVDNEESRESFFAPSASIDNTGVDFQAAARRLHVNLTTQSPVDVSSTVGGGKAEIDALENEVALHYDILSDATKSYDEKEVALLASDDIQSRIDALKGGETIEHLLDRLSSSPVQLSFIEMNLHTSLIGSFVSDDRAFYFHFNSLTESGMTLNYTGNREEFVSYLKEKADQLTFIPFTIASAKSNRQQKTQAPAAVAAPIGMGVSDGASVIKNWREEQGVDEPINSGHSLVGIAVPYARPFVEYDSSAGVSYGVLKEFLDRYESGRNKRGLSFNLFKLSYGNLTVKRLQDILATSNENEFIAVATIAEAINYDDLSKRYRAGGGVVSGTDKLIDSLNNFVIQNLGMECGLKLESKGAWLPRLG